MRTPPVARKRDTLTEPEPRDARSTEDSVPGRDLEGLVVAGLALCDSRYTVHCGMTIVPDGRAPETVAATGDVPMRVDWLQHELREGPNLDASMGPVLAIDDLAAQKRWPDFGKMCVAVMNVRSMVAIRIPLTSGDWGSLNLYAREPDALEMLDIGRAVTLSRVAAPRLEELLQASRARLLGPPASDYSRVSIAVATIMARDRVNVSGAFQRLRAVSRELDRAMLDVAIETAVTGRPPARPDYARPEAMDRPRPEPPRGVRSQQTRRIAV